jgi:hypothetical protein
MVKDSQAGLYPEKYFNELLTLEKKRRKRSEESAFLMLADLSAFTDESERQKIAQSMMDVLSNVIRDTDVKGWHVDGLVIGIIFTEMAYKGATSKMVQRYVASKCLWHLKSDLGAETFSRIQIRWQPLHSEHISKIHSASKSSH